MRQVFRCVATCAMIAVLAAGCSSPATKTTAPPRSSPFCDQYGAMLGLLNKYEPGTGGADRKSVSDAMEAVVEISPAVIKADMKVSTDYIMSHLDESKQPDFDKLKDETKASAVAVYNFGMKTCSIPG